MSYRADELVNRIFREFNQSDQLYILKEITRRMWKGEGVKNE